MKVLCKELVVQEIIVEVRAEDEEGNPITDMEGEFLEETAREAVFEVVNEDGWDNQHCLERSFEVIKEE